MKATIEFHSEESLVAFLLSWAQSGSTAEFHVEEIRAGIYLLTFTGAI